MAVKPFIIKTLKEQTNFGVDRDVCYSLGSGKNYKYLKDLNKELNLFKRILPLDHPRYIMQYKTKQKDEYIKKFVDILS